MIADTSPRERETHLVGFPSAFVAFTVAGVKNAVSFLLPIYPLALVRLAAGQDQHALTVELKNRAIDS